MSTRLSETTVSRLAEFIPEMDLRQMQVVTAAPWRLLPVLLRMSAVTFTRFVLFRRGSFNEAEPWGLALIAHEAVHVGQVRELGIAGFFARYLWGQFHCRFRHERHPLELPAIELQRRARAALEAEA